MHESPGKRLFGHAGTASVLALAMLILTACASAPTAPPAALTDAKNAIASAEQSDARQYAGAELDEANHKLAQAESALESDHLIEAEHFAHQSRVAAELAMARTSAAKAAEVNAQLEQDASALDEEMNRKGNQR